MTKLIVMDYEKFKELLDEEEYYEYRGRCGDHIYTLYYHIKEDGIYADEWDDDKDRKKNQHQKLINAQIIDLVDLYMGSNDISIYGYNEEGKYTLLNDKKEDE